MEGLILHRGGQHVTLDDLKLIETPPQTETYVPVPHYGLAKMVKTASQDLLRDFAFIGESYGVARQGNQLFAVLRFKREEGDMCLSIAYRNSLDKSMSIGMAFGGNVFCCDNLALRGDIVVMKKHTRNVWSELETLTITQTYKSSHNFALLQQESSLMKAITLTDDQAFQHLGRLYGHDVLSPRQLPVALEQWNRPKHREFEPRTLWSLYQATTEALKSSPPINVMENHVNAHRLLLEVT
jgi:hypothetical protein